MHKFINKTREFKYWNVDRKVGKFIPWLARKLPKKVQYYVVIHGMVNVEPDGNPTDVSGMELLNFFR